MSAPPPTDEQVAAAVVILVALAADDAPAGPPPSLWADRTAWIDAPLLAGAGAWRASGLPRR